MRSNRLGLVARGSKIEIASLSLFIEGGQSDTILSNLLLVINHDTVVAPSHVVFFHDREIQSMSRTRGPAL
jgi:hypothetical protein